MAGMMSKLSPVSEDLVVQRLPYEPLVVGMEGDGWNGMHGGVRNVFDLHRNAVLPHTDGLVIAGSHKAATLIHKGDSVDSSQVIVILLHNAKNISA